MKTALIIIDAQKGMFCMEPPVYKGKDLIGKLTRMISYCRQSQTPIIYIQHNGPENSPLEKQTHGWHIHESIAPRDQDIVIEKSTPDSFYETELKERLDQNGIQHLLLAGIQTEACVDTTCRRGFSFDYQVTLITDAHSTFDKEEISAQQIINHHNEVLRWFANTKTVNEVVSE